MPKSKYLAPFRDEFVTSQDTTGLPTLNGSFIFPNWSEIQKESVRVIFATLFLLYLNRLAVSFPKIYDRTVSAEKRKTPLFNFYI